MWGKKGRSEIWEETRSLFSFFPPFSFILLFSFSFLCFIVCFFFFYHLCTCPIMIAIGTAEIRFSEIQDLVSCQAVTVFVEFHLAASGVWKMTENLNTLEAWPVKWYVISRRYTRWSYNEWVLKVYRLGGLWKAVILFQEPSVEITATENFLFKFYFQRKCTLFVLNFCSYSLVLIEFLILWSTS